MIAYEPSEIEWQIAFVAHIDLFKYPDLVYWHVPNGEARPAYTTKSGKRISPVGHKLKLMGSKPGVPDMFFARPTVPLFCIELKRKGGAISPAQKEMIPRLEACHIPVWIVDDLDDAIRLLEDKQCVKRQGGSIWGKKTFPPSRPM